MHILQSKLFPSPFLLSQFRFFLRRGQRRGWGRGRKREGGKGGRGERGQGGKRTEILDQSWISLNKILSMLIISEITTVSPRALVRESVESRENMQQYCCRSFNFEWKQHWLHWDSSTKWNLWFWEKTSWLTNSNKGFQTSSSLWLWLTWFASSHSKWVHSEDSLWFPQPELPHRTNCEPHGREPESTRTIYNWWLNCVGLLQVYSLHKLIHLGKSWEFIFLAYFIDFFWDKLRLFCISLLSLDLPLSAQGNMPGLWPAYLDSVQPTSCLCVSDDNK